MNTEERQELKIIALEEVHYQRLKELDNKVADLRVTLTELNNTLLNTQREFDEYKQNHPEEPDVQEEEVPSDSE